MRLRLNNWRALRSVYARLKWDMPLRLSTRRLLLWAAPLIALSISACSTTLNKTIDDALPEDTQYRSSRSLPPLEIPPDLSSETIDDAMPVPGVDQNNSTTFSDYTNSTREVSLRKAKTVVLPDVPNVRLERDGDERWLVVDDTSPEDVWPAVREFLLDMGLTLEAENPTIGTMETHWAESREDLPRGGLQTLLGKILPAANQARTRDKFRVRLERGIEPRTTEVYIAHRGARLRLDRRLNEADTEHWEVLPPDPGLEAEMLTRLMVFFGMTQQRAARMMATTESRPARARMVREQDGLPSLAVMEDFPQAWRRTGLALDRIGLTVQDRDRARGVYYVRYVDPNVVNGVENESWVSKLKFWGDDEPQQDDEYLIRLAPADESTTRVVVLNKEGETLTSPTAGRILGLLHEQLR
ncbi:MAG: outer membrane protein assembly factor BamC [Gammaproteobacteria bacterium]|nr:outer membrane protein assembly factor BamC [Gammaproteobacteria bacterium]NIR81867.1 outer membrane protein assembly factor BamC [Gammaproteobacteria bacterium]NIR88699.1 outer membrane protein assembly factor BamC [Gammaproteobacteria bacterium]NIU02975.1 outer membrane protein assembly factor BamC [Gammaproteobacteria bacterium]NIV50496.1 outer membrane protein assembly factor BamC [Gammaproteobacteria bacterium]